MKRIQSAPVVVGLAITLGLVALHFQFARSAGALWRDEVNGANVASLASLGEAAENSRFDSFPIVWVALLHGWSASGLGADDAGLRHLGLLVGLAMVPTVWWTGRRLGLAAPLATLVLFLMNPATIVYGDSVRGYGFGALALVLCIGATWWFIERPSWRRFVVAQAAALLAVQTYFPNAVLLFAILVAGSAVCARRQRWRVLIATLAIGLVAAFSLALGVRWISYAFQVAELEQGNWSLAFQLGVFRQALGSGVALLLWCWGIAAAAALAGCGATWLRTEDTGAPGRPTDRDRALFALLSPTLALITYFAYLTLVARLPTQLWYYLSVLGLLALSCDVGIDVLVRRLPGRWTAGAWAACAAVAALAVAGDAASIVRVRMTNLDVVARQLSADARAGDLIVVVPWTCGITFDRYYQGRAPWITLPDFAEHKFHLHLGVKERMTLGDAGVARELARVESTLRSGGSVWVVGAPTPPPVGRPAHLPPAPQGSTRWRAAPYLDAWEADLAALLRDHGGDSWRIALPELGPVNTWENLPLIRVDGWRE